MARTLYFLRHGLADRSEYDGEDDCFRPLTDRGRERLLDSAGTLANLDWNPDLILTSHLTRARQTAEIVAEALGFPDRVVVARELACGFDRDQLADLLAAHPDARALALVGHEPDFSQVIAELTGGLDVIMKKGGLARVDLFDEKKLTGRLVWLIPPRILAL